MGYSGLSPRDYGVNLRGVALVDHRITRAPLKTELFLYPSPDEARTGNESIIWFGRPLHDPTFKLNRTAIYGQLLKTHNGPNIYSSDFSGNTLANLGRPEPAYDLKVYPYPRPANANEEIDPRLRRDDGDVFVVMLRAGRSLYEQPIDDPFYAAHNTIGGYYAPDYEATALGCVEQFRYCSRDNASLCTTWGTSTDIMIQFYQLNYRNDSAFLEEALDLAFIYIWFTSIGSVKRYLDLRPGAQVLLSSMLRTGNTIGLLDSKSSWTLEVETWFTTAFINARYSLLQIVRRNGSKRTEDTPRSMVKICRIVLFQVTNTRTSTSFG